MVKGKCISGENCNKNYCNNNGKCYSDSYNNNYDNIKCLCSDEFTGDKCNQCKKKNLKYPNIWLGFC